MDPYRQNGPDGNRPQPSIDGFLPPRPPGQQTNPQPAAGPPQYQQPRPANQAPVQPYPFGAQPGRSVSDMDQPARSDAPMSYKQPSKQPSLQPRSDSSPKRAARPSLPERHQGLRDTLSIIGVLASALLLALVLINFVFQSYQVDGPSMRTTLEHRDHLIVWKVDRTLAKLTGNAYIPARGDIIIFNEPSGAEPGATAGKQLIKRVIALPGERVVVKGTTVMVYNDEYPNGFNPDDKMPYGSKIIFEKSSNAEAVVGEDQVYVAGDNRDNSFDSRLFGPVDANLIVGKLAVRILPLNTVTTF